MDLFSGYGNEEDERRAELDQPEEEEEEEEEEEGGEIELDLLVNHVTGDIDVRQQGVEAQEAVEARRGAAAGPRVVKSALCEVCTEKEAKYTCPGCGVRSCCVECVKAHKAQSGCTGKRDRTAFVALQEYGERELRSDFGLLEDAKRVADNAHRHKPPTANRELPPHLASLKHQAAYRGVELLLQQPMMERRRRNSTKYDHNKRLLSWRVEWRFHGTEATCEDAHVPETRALREVLQRHLGLELGEGQRRFQLRDFAEAGPEGLAVVMRRERCPADQPEYYEIKLDSTLAQQLPGKCVIEYPTFTVLLSRDRAAFNIVQPEPYVPPPRGGGGRGSGRGRGRGPGGRGGGGRGRAPGGGRGPRPGNYAPRDANKGPAPASGAVPGPAAP